MCIAKNVAVRDETSYVSASFYLIVCFEEVHRPSSSLRSCHNCLSKYFDKKQPDVSHKTSQHHDCWICK